MMLLKLSGEMTKPPVQMWKKTRMKTRATTMPSWRRSPPKICLTLFIGRGH